MTLHFVDTSGWAAWFDRRETHHSQAVQTVEAVWNAGEYLTTSNWVLAELSGLLISPLRLPKSEQLRFYQSIRNDPGVRVVQVDAALEQRAWALWEARLDKDWSVVDCTSFIIMENLAITEAITADKHFEQAGFVRLLK